MMPMTLTVIFKVIGIGYNPHSADLGKGFKRAIFSRFWSRTYYFLNKYRRETDRRFICETISKL